MATLIISTAITLTWSPPTAVVPISYNINRRCRRVCESSVTSNNETSVSSPHTSTGIPPYSQCTFDLIGVYGADPHPLTNNYLTTTLSTAPTAPVGDIIFSSVESVSMTVSWDEVPCNGRNGPITGYYLTYTNITSDTSYTVNITGGDNRMYNLTGLIPYTNYTVSIIPYNYNMNGPARQEIQLTGESIPGVISDLRHSRPPTEITIVWNPPTIPNGIITVYEIRYRESTSTGPYNITNTTNTYYSILGLIPNTSYTIGVRAYTSIGPGEWTDRGYTTTEIQTFNGYIERKFEVKNNNTGATQSVTQYQITNWDLTGKLTNPQTILMVIEEMYRTQRKRGNTSIVVHCSDTVSRSAMFCAAATTINKCKTEGVIDVFQVLKSQRIQKPGSVQTVQQYQGIFQIVLTYLDSFETYSNFTT
uniref:Protein-tyrosine-phosphatase n=2 Tax=Amphimedon queenslandica TaxID=400682 RepID=A0A1X7T4F3_AMPQE